MRIFNKIIDSNKEPSNYNDIWFDGTSFRIYKEGEWQAITSYNGEGGSGLQYAVERTVYLTRIEAEGDEPIDVEITEEERAYNIETYTKTCNDGNVFVTADGILLSPFMITYGPTGYASFNCVMELDGVLFSFNITISANGDAVCVIKTIQTGGSVDPELLEGYMPLSRDFSDDFNNDFTR